MAITTTPGYSWTDGDLVTAARLNSAATGTISAIDATVIGGVTPAAITGTALTSSTLQVQNASADSQVYISSNAPRLAFGDNATYLSATQRGRFALSTGANNYFTGTKAGDLVLFTEYAPLGGYAGTNSGDIQFAIGTGNASALTPIGKMTSTGLNGMAIGATTASTGAFTNLSASGVMTYSGGIGIVASDFVVSASTSLANVTGLSVPIVSGGSYQYSINLNCVESTTGGFKYSTGGSGTFSASAANALNFSSGNGTEGFASTTNAVVSYANIGAGGMSAGLMQEGGFVCNGSGTFTVTFAQVSATGTSTVKAGSTLKVFRVS